MSIDLDDLSKDLLYLLFWCVVLDMTFDDDTKLFGLIRRYSDPEEAEELKSQVVNYVRTQIHDVNTEIQEFQAENPTQDTGEGEVQQMWSPEDQMLEMRKRQKMARL